MTINETITIALPADSAWIFVHEDDDSRSWTIKLADMVDAPKTIAYLVGRGYTINMQNCKALSKDQKAQMEAKGKDVAKYILDRRNRLTLGYMNGDFDDTAGGPRLTPEEATRRDVIVEFLTAQFEAKGAKDGKTYRLPDTLEALRPIMDAYMSKPANKARVDKEVDRRLGAAAKAQDGDVDDDLTALAEAGLAAEKAKRQAAAEKAKAKAGDASEAPSEAA